MHSMEQNLSFRLVTPRRLLNCLILCLLLVAANAYTDKGHFRGATLAWSKVSGNTIEVTLHSEWRRSYSGFANSGFTSRGPSMGDEVAINGAEVPMIDFGDGSSTYVAVRVTQHSDKEDWFQGVTQVRHTYVTPNNAGQPWQVSFTGCCRIDGLQNNANLGWSLTASVNLLQSTGSAHPALPSHFSVPTSGVTHVSVRGDVHTCPHSPLSGPAQSAVLSDQQMTAVNTTNMPFVHANGTTIAINGSALPIGLHSLSYSSGGAMAETLVQVIPTHRVLQNGQILGNRAPSMQCTPWLDVAPDGMATMPLQHRHYAHVGTPVTIDFCATDPDPADSAKLVFGPLPRGMVGSSVGGPMAIFDIKVQTQAQQARQLVQDGYEAVPGDANEGAGGSSVVFWVKRSSGYIGLDGSSVITQLALSTTSVQEQSLTAAGYTGVDGNLNEGAGGSIVRLWFRRGTGPAVLPNGDAADQAVQHPALGDIRISSSVSIEGFDRLDGNVNDGVPGAPSVHVHYSALPLDSARASLTWVPCPCDSGDTVVCAYAADNGTAAAPPLCTTIHVHADTPPSWSQGTPSEGSTIPAYIGQRTDIEIAVVDSNPARQVSFNIKSMTPQHPGLKLVSKSSPAPVERHPLTGALTGQPTSSATTGFSLQWVPQWNEGGRKVQVCIEAVDQSAHSSSCTDYAAARVTRCFTVEVRRCQYVVDEGQTLLDVARVYGTDWHTLLSLNPDIRRPEGGLTARSIIHIGHMYSIVAGDSLASVSQRFGSSLTSLTALNSDVQSGQALSTGRQICVLPDSCAGHAEL